MKQQTSKAYTRTAKAFHWAIALIILALLPMGFFMTEMAYSPASLKIYSLHKSLGLTVLFLGLLRLLWRFFHSPPPELETHKSWEKALSKLAHFLLYLFIFAMPLSGWLMSSAGDFPNTFFGLFEMPDLATKDQDLFRLTRQIHTALAFAIIGVVGLHMAGALKHHFIDRDDTLRRMTYAHMGFIGGALTTLFFGGLLVLCVLIIADNTFSNSESKEAPVAVLEETKADIVDTQWIIIPEDSSIHFSVTQYGQPFEGEFQRFHGPIRFDHDHLEDAYVRIEIDITSIRTGSDERDGQALGSEWFAADQFSKAVFEADQFESAGENTYNAKGTLSIRGVKTDFTLPFILKIEGDQAVMTSEITLNRLRYNIGQGQWESGEAIGLEVPVTIRVVAKRP